MNLMRFLPYMKHALMVVAMITIVGVTGCDDDEDKPTKNIWQLIEADPDLSIFKDFAVTAQFDATLSATTVQTAFIPNNAAMNSLLLTLFNSTDPALLAQISPGIVSQVLNYHLVAGENLSSSLTDGKELTTMQTEKIKVVVTTTGEKTLDTGASSDAKIVKKDVKATNGVMHTVDVVLVPPTIGSLIIQTLGTVAQPILLSSTFSTLAQAILKADAGKAPAETIVGALVSLTNVSIFAIPNQVFTAASITVDTYTAAQWNAIIRGHIVAEKLTTLTTGTKTSINSKVITITAAAGSNPATVKGAGNATAVPIAGAAIAASNGVTWPIAGILVHP